uniref:Ig-like domain-containing protein n=1 Tax=Oryzias latipes TaxID=8090 RepID=A0A3B3HGT7_ORYLA
MRQGSMIHSQYKSQKIMRKTNMRRRQTKDSQHHWSEKQGRTHYVTLHWYKHDSDLQAPQFILLKGAKASTNELISDKRYGSRTTDTSTELTIRDLNLADTALYYCVLERPQ